MKVIRTILFFPAFALAAIYASADAGRGPSGDRARSDGASKTTVNYAKHALQGFDMRVWISNQMTMGLQAWDAQDGSGIPQDPHYGLEYPAGSGIEHLFGGGPWIGGIVDGVRHVSEGYNGNQGEKYIRPDPRHPLRELIWQTALRDSVTEPNRRGCDDDGDGTIDEDDLDGLDNDGDWVVGTDDVGANGLSDLMESGCRGGYDAVSNPDPAFDNYDRTKTDFCHPLSSGSYRRQDDPDAYTEKNGIPDHGEPHVDEDYAAISDNDLYCSARDDNDVIAGHFPMGVKVVQKCYAWAGNFASAVIPFDYYFINTSNKTITDVYVGFFIDMDVGPANLSNYAGRNYSCYFDTLLTAYIHNPVDRGSTPLGVTVIATPKPLRDLTYVYQWFNFTSRAIPNQDDSTLYSWMSGEPFSPEDYVATCESPTNPSDTRFLLSFGKFDSFAPGETLNVSIALVGGEGVDDGPNNLKDNAEQAVKLFRRGFVQPIIPPSPSLQRTEGFQQVKLEWGGSVGPIDPFLTWDDSNKLAESFPPDHWRRINPPCDPPGANPGCVSGHQCDSLGLAHGGRTFEGYRLYRSEDPGDTPGRTSFTLIKEFDVLDGIGNDVGIDSVYVDSPLVRGKRYWYTVTSFGIPDVAVVDRPSSGGGIVSDTLYSPSPESAFEENMIRVDLTFSASDEADQVMVVPNPYRVDYDYTYENGGWEGRGRDWNETKRLVKFIHLPRKCTIRVFTLTGDLITTIEYEAPGDQPDKGEVSWNLLSESNRALASGVYVFAVDSDFGQQVGKFVLIR